MRRTVVAATATAALTVGVLVGQVLPVSVAFSSSSGSASTLTRSVAAEATVSVASAKTKATRVLTRTAAQRLAVAALNACQRRGFPVTATVVDRDGVVIVTVRDEDATGATVAVATGKAFAAVGFQSPTSALQDAARTQPGFINIPGFSILPGGQPIRAGGELVGGIGVSGAPSGEIDNACVDAAKRRT